MRCVAFGLNRARMLRRGMESPLSVLCIHFCSTTVSARCFIIWTIQSPAFTEPGVPGTRGPNATCCFVYDNAESALKAVFARNGNLSHAENAGSTATNRSDSASRYFIVVLLCARKVDLLTSK